jgi:hypothetical protein
MLTSNTVVNAERPIVVSPTILAEVVNFLQPDDVQKINAIKTLRRGSKEITKDTSLSLRDAKDAVERIQDRIDGNERPGDVRPRVITTLNISAVIINTGAERVEVDLEELQLRVLSEVGTIGLAECGRILDIVGVFQAWNAGKRVGVLETD